MLKGQVKYYILLVASITGIAYLAISYAQDTPPGTKTYDTAAYDALNKAQAEATGLNDPETEGSADSTRKNNPSDYLHQIADNTFAFLKTFNYFALNWLQIYTVPSSVELDPLFENYGKTSNTNQLGQLSLLNELYSLELKNTVFKTDISADTDYATLVQNINAVTGKPEPISADLKLYAKYFVKYASGLNIPHNSPYEMDPGKDTRAVKKYYSLYKTMNSIASYNAYVLSEHLVDMQTDFKLTQIQRDLKSYASDNKWVTHINEELSMGVILRQLLLFTSQMYIISLQSLETQKQLLATMAMTNSLIILSTGNYEKTLYDDATRK